MKYIDAEKLIAKIEKKRETLISKYNELAKYEVWRSANDNKIKIYTINDILSIITSLQQEQREVELDEEITRFWKKEKESGQYIDTSFDTFVTLQHIAYHFANWQKEQDEKVKI